MGAPQNKDVALSVYGSYIKDKTTSRAFYPKYGNPIPIRRSLYWDRALVSTKNQIVYAPYAI